MSTFVPALISSEKLVQRLQFMEKTWLVHWQKLNPGYSDLIRMQSEELLDHRFNLLGSGGVKVAHGAHCAGLEGHRFEPAALPQLDADGRWLEGRINQSNLVEAKRIWSLISRRCYQAIDWQLDFRSGYRWREDCWHRSIRFGHLPGVDIKLPWELARMQHLPVLSLAAHYANAERSDFRAATEYGCEVRNQMLDFIATNPPGFGVNWSCAMDVGIRLANMLMAHDMLLAAGQTFDAEFEAVFIASVRAHGRHLAGNLEWAPRFRGNHYLADIVGLLFAAVYLPRDAETDKWLVFATEELLGEVEYQFHGDGSNFEASVCYHRLSAEIVLWGLALLDGLATDKYEALKQRYRWTERLPPARCVGPVPLYPIPNSSRWSPVPPGCRKKMAAMAAFTQAMTRPDGMVVQFGDNDSGRFMPLGSVEQLRAKGDPAHVAWSLDHEALVMGIDAFLGAPARDLGSAVIAGLTGGAISLANQLPMVSHSTTEVGDASEWARLLRLWDQSPAGSRWRSEFLATPGLCADLEFARFAGMGCCIVRGPRLYLAVRCGEIGLSGLGAHAHCDQLAMELVIDGKDRVRDLGTYLYTALPERRNAYRSVQAHHAPRSGIREYADLSQGIFDLRGAPVGECLYWGAQGFAGRHAGYGSWVYRIIALKADRLVVLDFSPEGLAVTDPAPLILPYSPGYGRLVTQGAMSSP